MKREKEESQRLRGLIDTKGNLQENGSKDRGKITGQTFAGGSDRRSRIGMVSQGVTVRLVHSTQRVVCRVEFGKTGNTEATHPVEEWTHQ